MVVNAMELLIFCYLRKYTDWSINSIQWKTIFSDALSSSTIRKWGQVLKTPNQKLQKLLFSIWMGVQVQNATGSWKYLSVDLQYLKFNSNLKYNMKPTTSFLKLKNCWAWQAILGILEDHEWIPLYLPYCIKPSNKISFQKSQVVKEILKFENLINLIGL